MLVKPRVAAAVSSVITPLAEMALSTSAPEARPWWQVMQVASRPRPSTLAPEGNVTVVNFSAAVLWQVAQRTTDSVGAGLSTTPGTEPSLPRKSPNPSELWQRAQVVGTAPSLFQLVKAGAVRSACAECSQAL